MRSRSTILRMGPPGVRGGTGTDARVRCADAVFDGSAAKVRPAGTPGNSAVPAARGPARPVRAVMPLPPGSATFVRRRAPRAPPGSRGPRRGVVAQEVVRPRARDGVVCPGIPGGTRCANPLRPHPPPGRRPAGRGGLRGPARGSRNACTEARQRQHGSSRSSARTSTGSSRPCGRAATRSWDRWPATAPWSGTRCRRRPTCRPAGPTSRRPAGTGCTAPAVPRSSTGRWGRPRPRPRSTRRR